ncbi:MAG TPA: aminopeptidase P family protein, partial [Pyrinomonadaceae bacterium]|nr:aminopeptidase P family protein [Pyrinomonadaceae bacterium]
SSNDKIEPKTIRATPAATRFSDAERQTELARRRAKVFEQMTDDSMMILFSAEPKIYAGDVDFYYRQENNLYYLTNLKQNGATLVLVKNGGNTREILFLPKRNPVNEAWNGKMYSDEDAARISGVKTIVNSAETKDFLESVKSRKPFASKNQTSIPAVQNLYLQIPAHDFHNDDKREFRKETEFVKTFTTASIDEKSKEIKYESPAGYKIKAAQPIFGNLRFVKSPYEIKLLQHAIDITTEAQMRSMAMVGKAKWEYEVQAEVEYTFRRRNADYWGYPSIVGCGPNATTLHYVESQGAVKAGDLMLMDVGAEYDHYTADVTRTYPVNGKFSKEQAEIYQIIYDAQEAAAKATKPGARFAEIDDAAENLIKERLFKLGLTTGTDDFIPSTIQEMSDGKGGKKKYGILQSKLWNLHGLGHWLGMNVHDVGEYSVPLKAGAVFTNEPGIYVREDALENLPDTPANREFIAKVRPAFEKYKNIGVRIEDDMLVTSGGVEWMTKALPRKMEEIEAFMARASKEMSYTALNQVMNPAVAVLDADRFSSANLFDWKAKNNIPANGVTVRRGWIWTGKETTLSGLSHVEHSHGE